MKKTIIPLALAALLFASCSKSSYNSPNNNNGATTGKTPTVNYRLSATNTTVGIAQKTTAASNIQWTAGVANPTLLKFEAKRNGAEAEFSTTNAGQINILAATPMTFGGFTLPVGTYSEIELKIQLENNGATPALQLTGSFVNNGVTTPVQLQINESFQLKTEQHNITVDSSTFTAVTTLDLSTFTSDITQSMLQNATLTNGAIVISATSNIALYNALRTKVEDDEHHHTEFEHD